MEFDHILADHDDALSHGIILYTDGDGCVYTDKDCMEEVSGETLKDIYLKGCVVATVENGQILKYTKPISLEVISDDEYRLVYGGRKMYRQRALLELSDDNGNIQTEIKLDILTSKPDPVTLYDLSYGNLTTMYYIENIGITYLYFKSSNTYYHITGLIIDTESEILVFYDENQTVGEDCSAYFNAESSDVRIAFTVTDIYPM